eukprot:CAMPEP_0180272112 /NCGR_PEP_ID=MMETSP0988-20121125/4073_1 /TAXON_ID=697907 /ORGANISM="non described non described, Strain CCMP2293" /LENGTH=173 /DNA_ID=CAMNT_0022243165 /DNA_START=62 /DNA_END=583 /DNA_ORIENTATION=-
MVQGARNPNLWSLPDPWKPADEISASPMLDRRYFRRNGGASAGLSDISALRASDSEIRDGKSNDRLALSRSPSPWGLNAPGSPPRLNTAASRMRAQSPVLSADIRKSLASPVPGAMGMLPYSRTPTTSLGATQRAANRSGWGSRTGGNYSGGGRTGHTSYTHSSGSSTPAINR